MRAGSFCLLATVVMFSSSSFCKSNDTVVANEPFSFELYTSDVFSWITGKKRGAVGAEKNAMGKGLEKFLLAANSNAYFALYGVSKQPWFLQVIKVLRAKGIDVKAVVDQKRGAIGDWIPKNFTYPGTARLPNYLGLANILADLKLSGKYPRPSIMHHKYIVSDDSRVWFGTANLSHTGVGAEYNANVALSISSRHVARFFTSEFNQMFVQRRFSKAKVSLSDTRSIIFKDGTKFSAYFSPQDNVINTAIIPAINSARKTIDIGMFYLTARGAVQALCTVSKVRGVRVRIIVDAVANSHPSSPYWYLQRCGVGIKVENWGGKMHMKTAIIDQNKVIVGSMNWSNSGNERNDENLAIIENNKRLVKELSKYFDGLWQTLSNKSQEGVIFAEGVTSINSCSDGLDNDHDGFVDERDRGCREDI